tara:strand:- start:223 stop:1440 length:1218 start_codon:yes stop_codon:yes gene_type:complete
MGKFKKIQTSEKRIEAVLVPYNASAGTGWNTISGSSLPFTIIQRNPSNGRAFSNLYSSFNIPANSGATNAFLSTWANTGFSGLSQAQAIVAEIPKSEYGVLIDGRTVKLLVPKNIAGSEGNYTLYSSYYNPLPMSSDNSDEGEFFGNPKIAGNIVGNPGLPSTNVAFLFCDEILGPSLSASNTSVTSWSSGWVSGTTPTGYPSSGVDNFRFTETVSSSNTPKAYAQVQDRPVGIAYLDKGFAVITDPGIIANFNYSGACTGGTLAYPFHSGNPNANSMSFASAATQVYFTSQTSASCIYYSFEKEYRIVVDIVAGAGEFYITENQTASAAETPYYGAGGDDTGIQFQTPFGDVHNIWDLSDVTSSYITEIGLYDASNRLIATAIPDRPIEKAKNTPVSLQLVLTF